MTLIQLTITLLLLIWPLPLRNSFLVSSGSLNSIDESSTIDWGVGAAIGNEPAHFVPRNLLEHERSRVAQELHSYHQIGYECRCLIESKAIKGLFFAAQREIYQSRLHSMKKFKFLEYFHDRFFRSDQGADVFRVQDRVLVNVLMYKVNSEGIFLSLQRAEKPVRAPLIDLTTEWDMKKEIFTVTSPQLMEEKAKNFTSEGAVGKAFVFAFVRDPLQHFISGFVESHYRSIGFGARPRDENNVDYIEALKRQQANMTVAKNAVESLVRADRLGMDQWLVEREHFFPMTHALLKWRPSFIGRLESFEEDWNRLQLAAGITTSDGTSSGTSSAGIALQRPPGHPTQRDVLGMKVALQSLLFEADERYLRAICWLLLIDFHCLQYSLPPQCEDLRRDSRWQQILTKCKR